jgi:hypothetical protein
MQVSFRLLCVPAQYSPKLLRWQHEQKMSGVRSPRFYQQSCRFAPNRFESNVSGRGIGLLWQRARRAWTARALK